MLRNFYLMAKPSSSICNLNCDYCFYKDKSLSNNLSMTDAVLEKYIMTYINTSTQNTVTFIWQGGEPTLCKVDFFKKVVNLQHKYKGNKTIYNTIQTNGVLLDDEFVAFFKEHGFLVGISIDGPQNLHDVNRTYKNHKGTYQDVVKAIELLKAYEVDFNTLTVINKSNYNFAKEVYQHLKSLGSTYMQFIPLTGVEDRINAEEYGKFLIDLFEAWKEDIGQINIQHIDQWYMCFLGYRPNLCVFTRECGDQLIIEQNGDIYSCDHYVDHNHKLGNILTDDLVCMLNSPTQVKFTLNKSNLPSKCYECKYLFACNGGCPKHRLLNNGEYINQYCKAYYAALSHMEPFFIKLINAN